MKKILLVFLCSLGISCATQSDATLTSPPVCSVNQEIESLEKHITENADRLNSKIGQDDDGRQYRQVYFRMENKAGITLKFYSDKELLVEGALGKRSVIIKDTCSDFSIDYATRLSPFASKEVYSRIKSSETSEEEIDRWHHLLEDILASAKKNLK